MDFVKAESGPNVPFASDADKETEHNEGRSLGAGLLMRSRRTCQDSGRSADPTRGCPHASPEVELHAIERTL